MDIYCENNICPICNSNINPKTINENIITSSSKRCSNGCFKVTNTHMVCTFSIFGEDIYYYKDDSRTRQKYIKAKVTKHINYWKENERYLTKIMRV